MSAYGHMYLAFPVLGFGALPEVAPGTTPATNPGLVPTRIRDRDTVRTWLGLGWDVVRATVRVISKVRAGDMIRVKDRGKT